MISVSISLRENPALQGGSESEIPPPSTTDDRPDILCQYAIVRKYTNGILVSDAGVLTWMTRHNNYSYGERMSSPDGDEQRQNPVPRGN